MHNRLDNEIDAEGARNLANALKQNKNLTELNLSCMSRDLLFEGQSLYSADRTYVFAHILGNIIGDDGACALAMSLEYNKTLTQLNLGGDRFQSIS